MVILRRCCDTEDLSSTNVHVFVCTMGIGKEGYTFGTELLAELSHPVYRVPCLCHMRLLERLEREGTAASYGMEDSSAMDGKIQEKKYRRVQKISQDFPFFFFFFFTKGCVSDEKGQGNPKISDHAENSSL